MRSSEIQTKLNCYLLFFFLETSLTLSVHCYIKNHLPLNRVMISKYFSLNQSSVAVLIDALYLFFLCILTELSKSFLTYSLYNFLLKRY